MMRARWGPICWCRAPSQFRIWRGVDTPRNSVINAVGHLDRVVDRSAVYNEAAVYIQ